MACNGRQLILLALTFAMLATMFFLECRAVQRDRATPESPERHVYEPKQVRLAAPKKIQDPEQHYPSSTTAIFATGLPASNMSTGRHLQSNPYILLLPFILIFLPFGLLYLFLTAGGTQPSFG